VALHCVTARLKVRSAVARSGTQAGGSTVRSAVTVDSEMRDRSCAGYVAVTSLVGDDFSGQRGRPVLLDVGQLPIPC